MQNIPQLLKEFGAKVKKDGLAGYYIYEGVNFKVKFNSEYCVSSKPTWEVALYEDNVDKRLLAEFTNEIGVVEFNAYETKGDLVWNLFNIDKNLSIN